MALNITVDSQLLRITHDTVLKNVRLTNKKNREGYSVPERKGNRERRQRENGKGDVYNLGPRRQLRGSRYAKKGLPHGIRISSRSHLNFNLGGATRTLFGAVPSPLGGPRVRGLSVNPPRTSSGKRRKGLRDRNSNAGRGQIKKKKRAREPCALLKIERAYLARKYRLTRKERGRTSLEPR